MICSLSGREVLFNMINSFPTVHETFLASETYHRMCQLEEKVHSIVQSIKYTNRSICTKINIDWFLISLGKAMWNSYWKELWAWEWGWSSKWSGCMFSLWWPLPYKCILDLLWYLQPVVPWKMCEDYNQKSKTHKALWVPWVLQW
jgi:hypothetical protein